MLKIGLFNNGGDLSSEVMRLLEDENLHRSRDSRNQEFRRPRPSNRQNILSSLTSGSSEFSDNKTDSDGDCPKFTGNKVLTTQLGKNKVSTKTAANALNFNVKPGVQTVRHRTPTR